MPTRAAIHPLFDPSSLFTQLRASGSADHKMRGYVHWLAARAERQGLPSPGKSGRSPSTLADLAGILNGDEVLDAWQVSSRTLMTTEEIAAPTTSCEFCLLREADGSRSVGLVTWANTSGINGALGRRIRCRAFFFEPEVIERLESFLGGGSFLDAFRPEIVGSNLDVARILAAVCHFEGEWTPSEGMVRYPRRLTIADRYDLLPPRAEPLQIVVVFHPADEVAH